MFSIVVIGTGNVGLHLCKAINASKDLNLIQFYNRSKTSTTNSLRNIPFTSEISRLKEADLYIIAVSDDAIEKVSNSLIFEKRLVVHTSGFCPMKSLNNKNRRGVFYPLQTFTKASNLSFKNVPICIEATEKKDRKILKNIANTLGSQTYFIQSEQRQALHLSAVFINNFTNQIYRIAHELTDKENLDFDILKPLINETAHKVNNLSPYLAQTGPAKRNDKKVIKKHLRLLHNNPNYQKIYEILTKSIQKTHG